MQIATEADGGATIAASEVSLPGAPVTGDDDLLVVPTVQLYNLEATFLPSVEELMAGRTSAPYVEINAADAKQMKIADGDLVQVKVGESAVEVRAHVNGKAPAGSVLLPRHLTNNATPLALAVGKVAKV